MASDFWEKLKRVDAVSNEGRAVMIVMIMSVTTLIAAVEALVLRSWAPIGAAGLGWLFVAVYILLQGSLLQKGGDAIGSITMPSGGSTPSVAQHSNIETMEVRGEYAKAAAAYRAVIESSPQDVVACEKLAQLALRQLKDYELAVWAYRQADQRRAGEPQRQLGYALLVAGIYRDNIKDNGKAIVELSKVLQRFPDTANAPRLRAELEVLRARHFGAP